MEPVTTSVLIGSVIALLKPYVSKGAEEFAKTVGKDAYDKTKELFTWLKKRLQSSEESSQLISLFENKPERYEKPLEEVLTQQAQSDPQFEAELREKMEGTGPMIRVFQRMDEGTKVIGVKAGEIHSGNFDVQQDIKKGEEITGFQADKVV